MQTINNNSGLSLAMAVWLAHDTYTNGKEAFPDQNVISATSLLKSTRQLILTQRTPQEENVVDVMDMLASRFGHAIHDSIETAWKDGYGPAMKRLGMPQKMIDKVRINPTTKEAEGDIIPVYLEQRYFREITVDGHKIIISGQLDQSINGELNDTKTTSAFSYTNRSKEEDYRIQGSIYRWLRPDIITSDVMKIQLVFTDWQRSQAKINPNYPQNRLVEFPIQLMSLEDTEKWIKFKIREIASNQDLPEDQIIRCTDKELWKSDPQFKYYSDPKKAAEGGRSTKNFPSYPAAAMYCSKQGKGVVVTIPGQVKACGYCAGFESCTQREEYEHPS
jgi:hypothetical protein